jgi:hypothetical protein
MSDHLRALIAGHEDRLASLPGCMAPDGADPCEHHKRALDEIIRLRAENAELRERLRWRPIESAPDESVLLLYKPRIVTAGRGKKRFGMRGEPSQDSCEHRADCCGRFAIATHWLPIPADPSQEEGSCPDR